MKFFQRTPKFSVKVDLQFTKIEQIIKLMQKTREVFKDADLEITIR
ncbi:hypothetical protein [[Clostridium] colinum]|nr:hypothetical protein [[Clostridium] colinum]